jgi:radical SAM superfamily enzyme YgiQ (UPF0313 family)
MIFDAGRRGNRQDKLAAMPVRAGRMRQPWRFHDDSAIISPVATTMKNQTLKDYIVERLLPRVRVPAQYVGGEWNAAAKTTPAGGRLCLAFPDAYSIGMSCHGLMVLYELMNRRDDWAVERAFPPLADMEQLLRQHGLPLYGLESFTPLADFDILGFTLQYDLCASNLLTMLDLGGIPLHAERRGEEHPLVIAGGPGTANPEPMSRFIDLFVVGDGEAALPEVCELWMELKRSGLGRAAALAEMSARLPYVYVPQFPRECVEPAVIEDLEAYPPPTAPIVPAVQCVQERMAVEIMRGCPGRCRFCQSTTLKRPLRFRSVEAIVAAAEEQYRRTGYNELSLLSLSSSDYPHFDELMRRLQATFRPLHVGVSLPSLRVNEQLAAVGELMNTERHSSLTLAPEAARDTMRRRIGKPISNADLLAGCRGAFERGFSRVKLYFMCGLPGETQADLAGIVELSETISRLGKEVAGRPAEVAAHVANFVPKPQTPWQWQPMQREEYFAWAHDFLRHEKRMRSVKISCHDIAASLLEGVLCRGDRRLGEAIERAWQLGARFDAWSEHFRPDLWRQALAESGIDVEEILHTPRPMDAPLPWDRIHIRQGREYLERECRAGG